MHCRHLYESCVLLFLNIYAELLLTLFFLSPVLQHQLTMARLLSALAGCVGSPLAVLLGTSGERDANEPRALSTALSGEPISVGDGIFHLLYLLCKKVSQPILLLRPIHDFLISGKERLTVTI